MNYKVVGGKKLHGSVTTNTSKNAAVALLAASLLNRGTTTLKNVPKIEEVRRIIEVLKSIGVEVEWTNADVVIRPSKNIAPEKMDRVVAAKTRATVLFTAPLAHLFETFELPLPGGCKLGGRTMMPHIQALGALGIQILPGSESMYKVSSHEKQIRDFQLHGARPLRVSRGMWSEGRGDRNVHARRAWRRRYRSRGGHKSERRSYRIDVFHFSCGDYRLRAHDPPLSDGLPRTRIGDARTNGAEIRIRCEVHGRQRSHGTRRRDTISLEAHCPARENRSSSVPGHQHRQPSIFCACRHAGIRSHAHSRLGLRESRHLLYGNEKTRRRNASRRSASCIHRRADETACGRYRSAARTKARDPYPHWHARGSGGEHAARGIPDQPWLRTAPRAPH